MPHSLDQILPSLQSLGVLSYWLIGLASALEAYFLTGVVFPGTLVVDAGGILVQRGLLDFFDLVWFVALGSILGSELGYWTGRLAINRLPGRGRIAGSKAFARAQALFSRRGGLALVLGRFLGPVSGLVPLAAAMAGMERRRFLIWNVVGSIPYAVVHVAIGYALGDVMGRVGGGFTRLAVLGLAIAFLLLLLWGLLYSALRLLPLALDVLGAAVRSLGDRAVVRRLIGTHPRTSEWIVARFDRTRFTGLPLSGLALVFLYTGAVWLDSVVDFLSVDPMQALDSRLAELIHHFQAPLPIRIATSVTALGGWQVVWPLMAVCLIWLVLHRRWPLVLGLMVSVLGSTVSVAVLKLIFQRPRSPLGYFVETSGSFPSGHAAASIGFYGMAMYVLWRAGKLRAETALLGAGLAAFAIGVSRIYLIEHYLSDVLNGWLVGLLWLLVAVAVAEWLELRRAAVPLPVAGRWRGVGLTAMALLSGLAAANVWRYDHPRNPAVAEADRILADPQALARSAGFPAITESLLGSPLQPVSLVVLAPDAAALSRAVLAAGWTVSRPPTPGMVVDALHAAIVGDEDPTVETVAHFWRGQPNDLAFVAPRDGWSGAAGPAVHARFWQSDYVTLGGLRAFASSVGADEAAGPEAAPAAARALAAQEALLRGLQAEGAAIVARVSLGAPAAAGGALPPARGEAVVVSLP